IIASKDSKFGLTEVLFGIIPAYVFPLLLERVSYKKARFMILSSTIFSGEEAYDLGIADEISDAANLNKIEKKYVKRISFSSPKALSLVKKYSDAITENKIDESLDYAQKQLTELLNDGRNIENIKKFINGEKADWNEKPNNS
ncbi:MAG TPA: enoyl-CoA hydratase-related protein, partial [Spirochaetota bacterium]|nr:enoyl-CoA hydratase-related protein [Spirochaetota bacterium]